MGLKTRHRYICHALIFALTASIGTSALAIEIDQASSSGYFIHANDEQPIHNSPSTPLGENEKDFEPKNSTSKKTPVSTGPNHHFPWVVAPAHHPTIHGETLGVLRPATTDAIEHLFILQHRLLI